MPKNYPYKPPFLSKPADDDLAKQWVVEYGVWSEQREKLVRKRVVISGKSVAERLHDAKEVIELLTEELKAGVYFEPVDQPEPSSAPIDLRQDIACKEAIDYYLDTIHSSLSKASRRTYKTCGNTFRNYLKDKKLAKIKLRLFGVPQVYGFTDYLSRERKMGNRNFNNHRGWLVSFFEFYRKRKIITANPVQEAEIAKKKVASGQHIPFREDQIGEIVDYFQANRDDQFWLFLNCIYYTFARPHEELRLVKVRHLFERTLHINPTDSKDGDNNHKIIPAPLNALLTNCGSGSTLPITTSSPN
ncbi:phage integrase SAM-like domain-containing protein [Spirosoma sp. BT702]|uniref:Phage integrase SAM-like domain-containing protein n=1 Tax=Spirosoma profusum TaxID=2771354 RepID=A0A927AUS0_9BACT|nr:phage integrase SAM-like domain-containing protein [Spirosoma profusum]MBD2704776.1 phage integrase SAM-like domain-containing protein [Spirosoma profusum]